MYGIINRCYGILLQDTQQEEVPANLKPLVIDLLKLLAKKRGWPADLDFENDADTFYDCVTDIPEEAWGWTHYSGAGTAPLAIGFEIEQWACWELNDFKPLYPDPDEGGVLINGIRRGVITTATLPLLDAEHAKLQEKWLEKTAEIRSILNKHGVTPQIIWTTSTS